MMLTTKQLNDFLQAIRLNDISQHGWVSASCIDKCLKSANILKSQEQDEALLLLVVDAQNGKVSYARLVDEVELKQHLPKEQTNISQLDLVFKVMPELRSLFNKFDVGGLSLEGFRIGLKNLGLKETPATQELLRHTYEITFHQLVQALTRVDDKSPFDVNLPVTGQPRFLPKGRGLFDDGRADDKSIRKPHSTSKYSHPHRDPENRDLNMLSGDGIFRKGSEVYVTSNQSANSPMRGGREPETSAGYETRDKGLLRQQVHAAVRRLGAGEIDSKAFSRRLLELGIPLPENAIKLLERQNSGTRVPFKDWVKAFEPFFGEKTFPDDEKSESKEIPFSDKREQERRKLRSNEYKPLTSGDIFGESTAKIDHPTRRLFQQEQRDTTAILVPHLLPDPQNEQQVNLKFARGRLGVNQSISRPDFLCWSEEDKIRPPQTTSVPIRAHIIGHHNSSAVPPFARDGDLIPFKSFSGIDRSPEKRPKPRVPFGTEADIAASFANGIAPTRPMFG